MSVCLLRPKALSLEILMVERDTRMKTVRLNQRHGFINM